MYMNLFECLLNCNSASFNSNSIVILYPVFDINSNSRIELEFRSHSQFNSELWTSLIGRYLVTTQTGECRIDHGTKKVFKSVFYPVLDSMGELQTLFSKSNCKIMKGIQALRPQIDTLFHEKLLLQ